MAINQDPAFAGLFKNLDSVQIQMIFFSKFLLSQALQKMH